MYLQPFASHRKTNAEKLEKINVHSNYLDT